MSFLSAIELINSQKEIGRIEPSVGKEFATFQFTVAGQKVAVCAKGIIGGEAKASQFNAGKLQLVLDVSGDGVLLLAAEQLKKEIQHVLDTECLPEFEVIVTSWIKNKLVYITWPKKGEQFLPVTVNDKQVCPGTEEFDVLQKKLRDIAGVGEVEVGFSLYAWVRYGKDAEGKSTQKVTVGFSPQLAYLKVKE